MPESQEKIYYVCADSVEHASKMPQAERVLKAGYEVLYLTVDEDEIVLQMLENAYDKPFVSVASEDALPVTDAEKATVEQAEGPAGLRPGDLEGRGIQGAHFQDSPERGGLPDRRRAGFPGDGEILP